MYPKESAGLTRGKSPSARFVGRSRSRRTSGTSSYDVSVAKSGTPNTLTMLLPANGLFGIIVFKGVSLTIYENGFR